MHLSSHPRCREHAVWTLVSATCSHHVTLSPLIDAYTMRSGFHHASPGAESLLGREFAHSLGTRLLVSVLRVVGAIFTFAILLTIK